jgi:hypothetical protein
VVLRDAWDSEFTLNDLSDFTFATRAEGYCADGEDYYIHPKTGMPTKAGYPKYESDIHPNRRRNRYEGTGMFCYELQFRPREVGGIDLIHPYQHNVHESPICRDAEEPSITIKGETFGCAYKSMDRTMVEAYLYRVVFRQCSYPTQGEVEKIYESMLTLHKPWQSANLQHKIRGGLHCNEISDHQEDWNMCSPEKGADECAFLMACKHKVFSKFIDPAITGMERLFHAFAPNGSTPGVSVDDLSMTREDLAKCLDKLSFYGRPHPSSTWGYHEKPHWMCPDKAQLPSDNNQSYDWGTYPRDPRVAIIDAAVDEMMAGAESISFDVFTNIMRMGHTLYPAVFNNVRKAEAVMAKVNALAKAQEDAAADRARAQEDEAAAAALLAEKLAAMPAVGSQVGILHFDTEEQKVWHTKTGTVLAVDPDVDTVEVQFETGDCCSFHTGDVGTPEEAAGKKGFFWNSN